MFESRCFSLSLSLSPSLSLQLSFQLHILPFPLKKLKKDSTKCFFEKIQREPSSFPLLYFSLSLSFSLVWWSGAFLGDELATHVGTIGGQNSKTHGKY
jgi:hypothetical protein